METLIVKIFYLDVKEKNNARGKKINGSLEQHLAVAIETLHLIENSKILFVFLNMKNYLDIQKLSQTMQWNSEEHKFKDERFTEIVHFQKSLQRMTIAIHTFITIMLRTNIVVNFQRSNHYPQHSFYALPHLIFTTII